MPFGALPEWLALRRSRSWRSPQRRCAPPHRLPPARAAIAPVVACGVDRRRRGANGGVPMRRPIGGAARITRSPMRSAGGAPPTASSGVSCDSPEPVKPGDCAPWSFASTPELVRLRLDTAFTAGGERAAWTVDDARPDAIVAVNVGQFVRTLPWGWVVLDGHQFLAPGSGPLATAVAVDSSGGVRWIGPDRLKDADVQARRRRRVSVVPHAADG